jgi:hypothetical protein
MGLVLLFLSVPVTYAYELAFAVKPEFNRTFYYSNDFEFTGIFPLDDLRVNIKGGTALGLLGGGQKEVVAALKTFFSLDYSPSFTPFLRFGVAYIYNGLPQYGTDTLSILPFAAVDWKWAGFAVGITNRWSTFFDESAIYESVLALSVYVNFYVSEKFKIGLRGANYSDFEARNFGAYFFNLNSIVRILPQLSVINELELYQSGGGGLTTSFYGIAYRGGIVYKWD